MASIAFVFAGQGAQFPGMGKELYESSEAARCVFDRLEALHPGTLEMCFGGAADALNQTINTQPCLFAMDLACAHAAVEAGAIPDRCAGFSLGEVAAAAFAGVMDMDAAFHLVIRRAEAMQACAERVRGAMGAVLRLTAEQVEAICQDFPGQAYPVNYNCPGQTVVACREEIFEALSKRIANEKGRIMRLKVSGAFHTPWMEEAGRVLAAALENTALKAPTLSLYANLNALPYAQENAAWLLSRQVCNPVRWQQSIENMRDADLFIEVGAGKTLSGLIRKTLPDAQVLNVEKPQDLEKLKEVLRNAG